MTDQRASCVIGSLSPRLRGQRDGIFRVARPAYGSFFNSGRLWTSGGTAGSVGHEKILQAKYPGKPLLVAETGMSTRNGQPREDGVKRENVLRDSSDIYTKKGGALEFVVQDTKAVDAAGELCAEMRMVTVVRNG